MRLRKWDTDFISKTTEVSSCFINPDPTLSDEKVIVIVQGALRVYVKMYRT